jgi:ABC-2 type transport system permease protein
MSARTGLTGTWPLLRLAARRDRVLIPLSVLALTAYSVGSAQATVGLYADAETAMRELGSVLTSPSTLTLYGPATTTSLYGLAIFKTLLMGSVFVGLLAHAIVRRHTRLEEEEGRLELVGAGAVGRQAPLTAAVLLAVLATLLVGGFSAAGLAGLGFPLRGSLGFGAAWTITGLLMTGVTALACQLTSSARGAAGWALGTLGVLYLVRAVGDTATSDAGRMLRWASPLGWVNQVFPFGRDRLWLVGLGALVGAVLVALAYLLLERRDLGAGLLPSRPGRPRAPRTLAGPVGLAWRLTRPPVIGWAVGMVFLGAIYGNLLANVSQMFADPGVAQIIAKTAGVSVDQLTSAMAGVYSATMLKISVGFVAAAGIAVVLRLAAEERTTRAEAVLASATSRTRWFLAYAVGAFAVVAALILLMAWVMGGRGAAALAEAPSLTQTLQAAAEAVPAAWVLVGATALAVGLGARWAPWAWGVLGLAFVLGEFGATMNLPTWLVDVSPLAHVDAYPLGHWDWGNVVGLTAVAVALLLAGLAAYRRRDLA